MAMVSVEFGGLTELTRAVDNYRDNINTLYGNSDQFSLGPERVLRNIVVVMYAHYIDLFPISGACVGHRALLMYSMLEFAMLIGRYGHRERQINKHLDDPVDPSDPRLSVDTLVRSPEENERSAQMENVYEGAMQLLGHPDGVLYAEPLSMAQHYDLMVAGSRHIGYLPERSSRKTAEDVAALFLQERGELLTRIRSYVDNRTMECNIVVPTCLRTPVLILNPKECMRRYHDPTLQGVFPTNFPVEGFGFVQPRNDLRRSIIPPNFRELLSRVAAAMTTLIREDVQAADEAFAEYHSPIRGLRPSSSCSHAITISDPSSVRRQAEEAENSDTESARRMAGLSIEERCMVVRDIVSRQGNPHLMCPSAAHVGCFPTGGLLNQEECVVSPRRSLSVMDRSIAATQRDLAAPHCTHAPPDIPPLMTLHAQPAPSCSHLDMDVAQVTGRQLDARKQNRRDMSKWAPSPAAQLHPKKARTPSTEEEDETDQMVWLSREEVRKQEHARARSASRNSRRRRAKSASRMSTSRATRTKESFIPAGYENTRREELQRESRENKAQASQLSAAQKAAQLEQSLKEEVLNDPQAYIWHVTRRLKSSKMSSADARVRCLWIFEGSATAYSAHILAIFDWAYKFYKVGGEYPVSKLPSWLTTYIHVTSIPRFPEGLPDLPRQRTAMRIDEPAIQSPATWQWMADLLQYWSDVSNTKTPGGLFRTQSALVERLMDTVNLWFSEKHRVTWSRVAFGTFHWLQARTMFTLDQKADYERQLRREGMELNDLEAATQRLWQEWMEADEMKKKQQQAKAAAQRQLPPERQATQLEWEKQAKVTGLGTSPSVENHYPGWVARPQKKPADGHDPLAPYQAPRDVRERDRNQTIDERNAALADELGANDVLDPLELPSPGPLASPGPQTPPQFEDADIDIPSISLPGTSPITNADNQLLGASAESPMEATSASTSASTSTISTPSFSRAPGSAVSSVRGTPMSLASSPAAEALPPGLGRGTPLYLFNNSLLPQIAFEEALRRNREAVRRSNSSRAQQVPREQRAPIEEEPESPFPNLEEDEDWK